MQKSNQGKICIICIVQMPVSWVATKNSFYNIICGREFNIFDTSGDILVDDAKFYASRIQTIKIGFVLLSSSGLYPNIAIIKSSSTTHASGADRPRHFLISTISGYTQVVEGIARDYYVFT